MVELSMLHLSNLDEVQVGTTDFLIRFDGGAAVLDQIQGQSGFHIWGSQGLLVAKTEWYGCTAPTVNTTEASALVSALE